MGIMYKLMKHRNLTVDLNTTPNNVGLKSDRNRLITIEGNIIEAPVVSLPPNQTTLNDDLSKNMDINMDKQFTAEHIIQLCKFLAEKSKRNKNLYKQQQSPKKLIKPKQSQFHFQQMEYDDSDEADLYQNEALPLLTTERRRAEQQKLQQQQKRVGVGGDDDECGDIAADNNDDDNNENNDVVFEGQHDMKASAVLSTRLSPDINSLNISSNTAATTTTATAISCALQHHQQQQQPRNQQSYNEQQQQHQQQQQQQQYNPQYPYQPQHHQQQQQQHDHQHQQNQGKRDILLKIRRQIFERKRLRENGAFEAQPLSNAQVWRPW